MFVLLLLIRLVIYQCLSVIFARTGNSFEVKTGADSSDTTEYEHDDKPRSNIGTKRSLKVCKSTNDGEKQYRCTVCDKRFKMKQNLAVHSRRHTVEHLYSCSQCEKSFSCPSSLSHHKNIHTGEYKCTECGRCCESSSVLAVHRRSHSRQKPFECTFVLCVSNDSQDQIALSYSQQNSQRRETVQMSHVRQGV